MFSPQVIPAGPVELRPPSEKDVEAIVRACADPLIVRFIPLIPVPYTRDDALAFLQTAARSWEQGGADFAIADPATGDWLGNIGLKPPHPRGAVEVGYLVAPWARGRGVASTALRALTEWAFAHGVPRVELVADVENVASQRVAYAAGFAREGVQRGGGADRDGTRRDMVVFARLAGDPGEPIRPYLPYPPGDALDDGVVRLAPITVDDAADFHRMMCDPDVVRYRIPPEAPSLAEMTDRCTRTGMWWLAGERAELSIRDAATGEFAGHIQLVHIMPPLGEAMVGYSLLPEYRGRGMATRAVRLLVEWVFANTPLWRIVAGTNPANTASQRVLERAGFSRETLLRQAVPAFGGGYADDLRWVRRR